MTKNSTTKPAAKKNPPKTGAAKVQETATSSVHVPLGLDPKAIRALISLLAQAQPGQELRLKLAEQLNEAGTHALLVTPHPSEIVEQQETEESVPGTLVTLTEMLQQNSGKILQASHMLNIQLDRIDGGNPDGSSWGGSTGTDEARKPSSINNKLEGVVMTQRQTIALLEQALNRVIALVN